MKDADARKWKIGAVIAALGVGAFAFFRPGKAGAATVLGGGGSGSGSGGPSGASWDGDVKAMQAKINALGGFNLAVDGKAGVQTCQAAEKVIAAGKADADMKAFAKSKLCGYGLPRAPCGIGGPVASEAVRKAILDAGAKRGYPRADIDKAAKRESGWHAQAVACTGTPKHPVAGGMLQLLASTLRANGFDGSPDQFASLTAEQQLPIILSMLGKMPQAKLNKPGDFGLALFWPAAVNKPDEYVIAAKGGPNADVWEQNPGLREPGGGPITAGYVRSTAR